MNQEQRLNYLIEKLNGENSKCKNLKYSAQDKANVFRSLMNIRLLYPLDDELLSVQDKYLTEELAKKGIVSLQEISTVKEEFQSDIDFADKVSLWQGDITRLKVDAIVNAANSQMLGCFVPCHRCIDNAIHSAAGMQLRNECEELMNSKRLKYGDDYEEPTGRAEITSGYNLPCRYVIHTVGPIVTGSLNEGLKNDLENCYEACLRCAIENGVRSIAFCCISTGEFHFPNKDAAVIAVQTVKGFLQEHLHNFDRVIFNVFKDIDYSLYKEILNQ